MTALTPEYVVSGLVARGVPAHIAQGVTARWTTESGLDPGINEINPTVKGSRGGFGFAQWTGPRRVALEQFAAARGVPASDPEAQLDFFMVENAGPEKEAWGRVLAAKDATEAAKTFTLAWERPGVVNMGHTLKALSGISQQSGAAGGETGEKADPASLRLAFAYRNGMMSPEDQAIYERGVSEGRFKAPPAAPRVAPAAPARPDPLEMYQRVAQRQSTPTPQVSLQAGMVKAPRPEPEPFFGKQSPPGFGGLRI